MYIFKNASMNLHRSTNMNILEWKMYNNCNKDLKKKCVEMKFTHSSKYAYFMSVCMHLCTCVYKLYVKIFYNIFVYNIIIINDVYKYL